MNYFFSPFTPFNNFQTLFQNSFGFYFYPFNYSQQTANMDNQNLSNRVLKIDPHTQNSFKRYEPLQNQKRIITSEDIKTKTLKKSGLQQKNLNFELKQQNKSRNIHSNILKRFFTQLCEKRSMDSFILRNFRQIIDPLNLNSIIQTAKQLFVHSNKTYFSPKTIRQTLNSLQSHDSLRKILTVCLCRFLKEWFPQILLVSKRIRKNSKLLQMKKSRQLLKLIKGERQQEEKTQNQNKL